MTGSQKYDGTPSFEALEMAKSKFPGPKQAKPASALAAKDREIARLREALERVLDFDPATPGPSSTAEELLLGAIAIARAALAQDGREP